MPVAGHATSEEPEVVLVRAMAEALGPGAGAALVVERDGSPHVVAAWPPGAPDPAVAAVIDARDSFAGATGGVDVIAVGGGCVVVVPPAIDGQSPSLLVGLAEGRASLEPGELRLMEAFARAAATVVRLSRDGTGQREDAARARQRAALLAEAGATIGEGLELHDVLRRLVEASREVIGARYAALGVLNEDHTELRDFIWSGLEPEEARAIGDLPHGRGILGALIRDACPLRLGRLADDPRSVGFPSHHPAMSSFLGVPLAIGGEVFGNLYLAEKIDGTFTEEDERMAIALAAQAAAAVDKVRRLEREERRVAELESVQEVAAAMLRTLDLDSLLPLVAQRARRLTGADLTAVGLIEAGRVRIHFADGHAAPEITGQEFGVDDERAIDSLKVLAGASQCSLAWLTIGGERAGILAAYGHRPFGAAERRLLDTFASQAAIAVANAKTFAEERERLMATAEVVAAREREKAAEDGLRRAISAQEAERARIARELHDETGQVLTALAVQLRALEGHIADEGGREQLAELRALVNSAASGLRSLATELRPSGLREHGLAAAIARHAERVQQMSGIRVDQEIEALPGDLTEEVQIAIFRVVQEALTNVARHSGAGRASILATHRGGRLRVVVEDDGAGFDPSVPTGRLGIAGMHERMEIIGGEFRVESAPGAGAAVVIDLEVAST